MEDGQQTELEALKEKRDEADEAYRKGRALEEQRRVLLPQLSGARQRLLKQIRPLETRLEQIDQAVDDIAKGKITSFRLRKPRQKKVEEPSD